MDLDGMPNEFLSCVSDDASRVSLASRRLTSVPDWLGSLTALTSLDVSGNQLTSLPDWLGNLTALTSLDVSGNQLTSLPDWLGNLTALTRPQRERQPADQPAGITWQPHRPHRTRAFR